MANRLRNQDLNLRIPFNFKESLINGFNRQINEKVQLISTELNTYKASSVDDTFEEAKPKKSFEEVFKDSILHKNLTFLKDCYARLNNDTLEIPSDGLLVREYNTHVSKNIDSINLFSEILNYYETSHNDIEEIWNKMSKRISSLKQNGDLNQK